jgi:hypothetical protein
VNIEEKTIKDFLLNIEENKKSLRIKIDKGELIRSDYILCE